MGQTTTAINACNVLIMLDDGSGTPVDISGSANNASLEFTRQVGSGFTFDGDYPIRIECKKDATLSLDVMYTIIETEGRELLEDWFANGGRRTVSIYPYGQDTGNRYYSGEWRIESLSIPLQADSSDPIVVSCSLIPDGAIDFLKWAS